jgi:7,8-dihydroneopterin aldolase/epimerase/oxygenase
VDRIALRGVRAYGRHGVDASERAQPQPLDIDVMLEIDLRAAQASDDIAHTVDYAVLRERLMAVVASTSYALLERLAGDLLDELFDDRRVVRAEVTLSKPAILDGATPSVTLDRVNPRYGGS